MESSHASLPPGMMMAGSEVAHRFSAGQQHGAPASAAATPLTTTGLCKGIELKNNNQVAGIFTLAYDPYEFMALENPQSASFHQRFANAALT